ncbi:hypothetical protein LXL04_032258 [Taraxacum kok-saghyz]
MENEEGYGSVAGDRCPRGRKKSGSSLDGEKGLILLGGEKRKLISLDGEEERDRWSHWMLGGGEGKMWNIQSIGMEGFSNENSTKLAVNNTWKVRLCDHIHATLGLMNGIVRAPVSFLPFTLQWVHESDLPSPIELDLANITRTPSARKHEEVGDKVGIANSSVLAEDDLADSELLVFAFFFALSLPMDKVCGGGGGRSSSRSSPGQHISVIFPATELISVVDIGPVELLNLTVHLVPLAVALIKCAVMATFP